MNASNSYNRYCLCLDLKNNPHLISEYEDYHRQVWPEILESLRAAGIISAEIYRWQNRLFMIMETIPEFTFEQKTKLDSGNSKVKGWEKLMWKYQQSLPGVKDGSKWQQMNRIFSMEKSL